MINKTLKDEEEFKSKGVPINPENDDLFHVVADGQVLIRLLNEIDKDAVDMRTVNKGSNLNVYKIRENLNLALTACTGLIQVMGIGAGDFLEKTPHLVLGVMWQVARLIAIGKVQLKDCPEIMRLATEDEELKDLQALKPEQILIRWVNFHLKQSGQEMKITNLGKDLADSKALIYVIDQLSEKADKSAIDEADDKKRAELMIASATDMGVEDIVSARDIVRGNAKVNTLFVAELFNTKHGLEELTKEEYEKAGLVDDDIEGSREERSFRLWINSLGIDGVFVNNLYEEARDGQVLLKVIDKIDPTAVEWNRVEKNPNNHFKRGINCQVAFDAAAKLKISLIGLGAVDIQDGHKKNLLAIVWQLVRIHYLKLIGSKTDKDIIAWANEAVPDMQITGFRDKSLADGKFLIKLCAAIEPRVVNWDLVTTGETEKDRELNAKYAISIARKLGAIIFLVWDDIPNLNPKMLLIFMASLYDLKQQSS